MENRLLEVKGVDVLYGDIQAVWEVSLHVEEGTIVALVGSNGAGKTTLLKTISGIIRAKRGEILFSGKLLNKLKAQVEKAVGEGAKLLCGGRYEGLCYYPTVLSDVTEQMQIFSEEFEKISKLF